jgi:hypothetical protein
MAPWLVVVDDIKVKISILTPCLLKRKIKPFTQNYLQVHFLVKLFIRNAQLLQVLPPKLPVIPIFGS